MPDFAYEREMYDPVIAWLERCGFQWVKHLCTPIYHQCDLAAGRYAERINRRRPQLLESLFIELKLSNVAQAIGQAAHYRNYVNLSYVAMPATRCAQMKSDTVEKFRVAQVGLLSVSLAEVREVVRPTRNPQTHEMIERNLWRRIVKHQAT
jgi:hypothetical protein